MSNIFTALQWIGQDLDSWKEAAWTASKHPRDPKTGRFASFGTEGAAVWAGKFPAKEGWKNRGQETPSPNKSTTVGSRDHVKKLEERDKSIGNEFEAVSGNHEAAIELSRRLNGKMMQENDPAKFAELDSQLKGVDQEKLKLGDQRKDLRERKEQSASGLEKAKEDVKIRDSLETQLKPSSRGDPNQSDRKAMPDAVKFLARAHELGIAQDRLNADPVYQAIGKAIGRLQEGRFDKAKESYLDGNTVTYDVSWLSQQKKGGTYGETVKGTYHRDEELGLDLAIRKNETPSPYGKGSDKWFVDEITTGSKAAQGYTRQDALDTAKKNFSKAAPTKEAALALLLSQESRNKPPIPRPSRSRKRIVPATGYSKGSLLG